MQSILKKYLEYSKRSPRTTKRNFDQSWDDIQNPNQGTVNDLDALSLDDLEHLHLMFVTY